MPTVQPLKQGWGVYIHIPFCRSKCAYCDFYSHGASEQERREYAQAVIRHIAGEADKWDGAHGPTTVFFGGGTPSLLPPESGRAILKQIRHTFGDHLLSEVTIEANPGTVTGPDLLQWVRGGCNRLSLGVQAFQPRLLAFLGRKHSLEDVRGAVTAAKQAGLSNVNLDLIYGIPGQSMEDWRLSLELALDLEPAHLSLYNLKPEAGTPLALWLERGLTGVCPEDLEVEMYEEARRLLHLAGFRQYELSNFARPGWECRHNLNYWHRGDYLGFGSSAASGVGLRRWTWAADSRQYVRALSSGCDVPIGDDEMLTPVVAAEEAVMLGLRLTKGVNLQEVLRRYGLGERQGSCWHKLSTILHGKGWVDYDGSRVKLMPESYLVANEIMEKYLGEESEN
ncbi:radical SAM family heme chaperone HemW [Heliobacillus mobilis]|uniref:Heme chaperone HemW n=1 Tax=Heliobacterium mobile TaxID=28064 RepID=A0A6I3SMC9_HELMO|nr:radical SAM family heme chaperone HemW [Heliobacterium mobile]MTV50133.1 radical SAM family heme chaperone HemW [Heliobacterium mobile]